MCNGQDAVGSVAVRQTTFREIAEIQPFTDFANTI
jgi:hypothetical protein